MNSFMFVGEKNLYGLNEALVYHKFKMSIDLITKDCYMANLDWKDAYY